VTKGDIEGFVQYATEGLGNAPAYFSYDAETNREGAATIEDVLAAARPLGPAELESLAEDGVLILDTRSIADFGDGHIPGSLHIPLEGKFAPWVGSIVPPSAPILVVADESKHEEAITRLARIGYEKIGGWLEGGIKAWRKSGGEIERTPQLSAQAARQQIEGSSSHCLLDVRTPAEWDDGHANGALHIPLNQLGDRLAEVPHQPLAVLCGTGYRSSIACSILQRSGRRNVSNVAGGWESWQKLESEP
jgi:rhodanese-related sulfurtransferase